MPNARPNPPVSHSSDPSKRGGHPASEEPIHVESLVVGGFNSLEKHLTVASDSVVQ